MNTRAPTNIHTRLSFDNGVTRTTDTSNDEGEIPMGGLPRRAALKPPEWMISSSSTSSDSFPKNKQDEFIGDLKTGQRSKSIPPHIVPLPSPATKLTSIDREALSESEEDDDFKNIVRPIRGGTVNPRTAPALADFNSRWASSQQDMMTSSDTERPKDTAAAYSAQHVAESKFQREEQSLLTYQSSTTNANNDSSSQNKLAVLGSLASRARDSVSTLITSPKSDEDMEKEELMRMSQHQRIRAEALRMLQLADLSDVSPPVQSPADSNAPQDPVSYGSKTHSLYRTASGGYSSSFGGGGVSESSVSSTAYSRNASSFVGLGPDNNGIDANTRGKKPLFDKRFSIQEDTEDDNKIVMIEEEEERTIRKAYSDNDTGVKRGYSDSANKRDMSPVKANMAAGDSRSSSWSKRYSENRLFMALNSGMSPNQVQDKIEQDRYNATYKNTSATNMFKSGSHDLEESSLFGSKSANEDYSYWYQNRRAPLRAISSFLLNITARAHLAVVKLVSSSEPSSPKSSHGSTSPTSWNRNINLMDQHHDLPTIPFSPKYDDVLERQEKRRRIYKISLLFILIVLIFTVAISLATHKTKAPPPPVGGGVLLVTTNTDADVTFYVTSDTLHSSSDQDVLRRQLSSLDAYGKTAASFLIHLGGVLSLSQTNCSSQFFTEAAALLKESPLPVFVIPGDNDWAICPDPTAALDTWRSSFVNFETKNVYKTGLLPAYKSSQAARPENFSFLLNGILFIGLDLISDQIPSTLTLGNIQWIEMNLSPAVYSRAEYRAVIILGHAPISSTNGPFFYSILDTLAGLSKPLLYIHANDGSGEWKSYVPFPELPKFQAVMLQNGWSARPVKVTASRGTDNIFNFFR